MAVEDQAAEILWDWCQEENPGPLNGTHRMAIGVLIGTLQRLKEEVQVTDKLFQERDRVLRAVPECPEHGLCVPYALQWIKKARIELAGQLRAYEAGRCETTSTQRYSRICACPTYAENLGCCAVCELGSSGRCVYCDHEKRCHRGGQGGDEALRRACAHLQRAQVDIGGVISPAAGIDPVLSAREVRSEINHARDALADHEKRCHRTPNQILAKDELVVQGEW